MNVVVRRWLPGESFARGALYGAVLLVVFGGGSIDADNIDLRLSARPGWGFCSSGC
jgi:hypothetical protein